MKQVSCVWNIEIASGSRLLDGKGFGLVCDGSDEGSGLLLAAVLEPDPCSTERKREIRARVRVNDVIILSDFIRGCFLRVFAFRALTFLSDLAVDECAAASLR